MRELIMFWGVILVSCGFDGRATIAKVHGGSDRPTGPQPDFGETIVQEDAPPPISGGTLEITDDGAIAVAADSDRDRAYVVSLADPPALLRSIAFAEHSEPGRVALDTRRAHLVLRRSGQVVTFDIATGAIVATRTVCRAPRGIAYDRTIDSIRVACMDGDLVTLPAAGGAETERIRVERDLRDVVVMDGAVFVSTLRPAKIFRVAGGSAGRVSWTADAGWNSAVARRMRGVGGKLNVLVQGASGQTLPNGPAPRRSACSPLVGSSVITLEPEDGRQDDRGIMLGGGLIVDFAWTAKSGAATQRADWWKISSLIVAAPGNGWTKGAIAGGPLQTPSLVGLGSRSPLLHDGCAKTIRDRFSQGCRADKHGFVPLTADEMNDLVSFLDGL